MVGEPVAEFLQRLEVVEARLEGHATRGSYSGLTARDAATGERWDAGQLWAHLAILLPYWIGEVRGLVASQDTPPIEFGQAASHQDRIAAIENGRHEPIPDQMGRVSAEIAAVRALAAGLPHDAWSRLGRNRATGEVLSVRDIVDRIMIGRLEGHADLLDDLAEQAARSY